MRENLNWQLIWNYIFQIFKFYYVITLQGTVYVLYV